MRPQSRLHLSVRPTYLGPPYLGADVWILPSGDIQVIGYGLRLKNSVREDLKVALVPELLQIGQDSARLAAVFDAKTSAAGLNLPFRKIQTPTGRDFPAPGSSVDLGGVGAGVCTFQFNLAGQLVLHVPWRPAPAPGRPLAPITAAAQERWDRTWAPVHAAALQHLLQAEIEVALRQLLTASERLPSTVNFS